MPAPTYGTPSPRAQDPWPIETSLATAAYAGDRSQLQSELQSYQLQRAAAEGQYGHELDAQHQYAKQQLAQQLYEAKLKEIAPIAGKPGGTQFLAGMPGMEGFGSPASWANFAGAANTAQGAENFKNLGEGFNKFSEGGWLQDVHQLPGMEGAVGNLTDTSRVRVEAMKINAARAAAALKDGGEPKGTVGGPIGYDAQGNPINVGFSKVPMSQMEGRAGFISGLAAKRKRAAAGQSEPGAVVDDPAVNAASPTTPTGGGPGASTTAQPAAPAQQALPGVKAKPAATTQPEYRQLGPAGKIPEQGQKDAMVALDTWKRTKPDWAADVQAGMEGGHYTLYQLKNGQLAVKGKGPTLYPLSAR